MNTRPNCICDILYFKFNWIDTIDTSRQTQIKEYNSFMQCTHYMLYIHMSMNINKCHAGALGTLILCLCSSLIVLPNVDQYIMADLFYRM